MSGDDPYDRNEVISACARHAWQGHANEFKSHGIGSEAELRDHVSRTVEGQATLAFRCEPKVLEGQSLCREGYAAAFHSPASAKDYQTIVFLNPNRDEHGRLHGGTCVIRDVKKRVFAKAANYEKVESGKDPQICNGGRPALRTRESLEIRVREAMKREAARAQTLPPWERSKGWDRER